MVPGINLCLRDCDICRSINFHYVRGGNKGDAVKRFIVGVTLILFLLAWAFLAIYGALHLYIHHFGG